MEYSDFIFEKKEQAEHAISLINQHFGIPVSEDAVTRTYTDYIEEDGKFIIKYLPELEFLKNDLDNE